MSNQHNLISLLFPLFDHNYICPNGKCQWPFAIEFKPYITGDNKSTMKIKMLIPNFPKINKSWPVGISQDVGVKIITTGCRSLDALAACCFEMFRIWPRKARYLSFPASSPVISIIDVMNIIIRLGTFFELLHFLWCSCTADSTGRRWVYRKRIFFNCNSFFSSSR